MRYVMVWFTCDNKDCDAKAETLVKASAPWSQHAPEIDQDTVPDGWSRKPKLPAGAPYFTGTYCPTHGAKP